MVLWILVFIFAGISCNVKNETEPPDEPANAPQVREAWKKWIKKNHYEIHSLEANDTEFSDLRFLKNLIGSRRLVQLGESSHGVSEFNKAKVRLIKFLHEKMGFNVIAFESGLYECFITNENGDSLSDLKMMKNSIFGVWHCSETLELFKYIKETRNTSQPLILAGFDIQLSTLAGIQGRPQMFQSIISKIDPVYADKVMAQDTEFIDKTYKDRDWIVKEKENIIAFYTQLTQWFDSRMADLIRFYPDNPRLLFVLRQSAWSMPLYTEEIVELENHKIAYNIRDKGMADNIGFLLNTLYPNEKIINWAHNYHVMHGVSEFDSGVDNMGYWISQRHRSDLYTIGLVMYEGKNALNNREIIDLKPAPDDSLEAIMYYTGKNFSFVNLLNQHITSENSWMTEKIYCEEWGQYNYKVTPQKQYDGIFFVKTVNPPNYL